MPLPTFTGGTKAITMTPIVGTPRREYAETFVPMIEAELRTVYDGAVVHTQDLTVFNVTREAIVARQAQVIDQLPPTPGKQRVAFTPSLPTPPEWWAEARIPLE